MLRLYQHSIKQNDLTKADVLCVDKDCDYDKLRDFIRQTNTNPNMPKRYNGEDKSHSVDWYMDKIKTPCRKCLLKIQTV